MTPVLSLPSFTGDRNNIDIFLYNWRALFSILPSRRQEQLHSDSGTKSSAVHYSRTLHSWQKKSQSRRLSSRCTQFHLEWLFHAICLATWKQPWCRTDSFWCTYDLCLSPMRHAGTASKDWTDGSSTSTSGGDSGGRISEGASHWKKNCWPYVQICTFWHKTNV